MQSIEDFYKVLVPAVGTQLCSILPESINNASTHFNVVNIAELMKSYAVDQKLPYSRKAFYKISLIKGRNRAEYADKTVNVEKHALLFATPKIPYHWLPQDNNQTGTFCIFTEEFMSNGKNRIALDSLPIFQPGGYPIFELNDEDVSDIEYVFSKMSRELTSDYQYRDDYLRNLVIDLIHLGQKLQPAPADKLVQNASQRISSLFMELLERQFPIEKAEQQLSLRTAKDFAERLAVHVNHLNRALKEITGKTTSFIIGTRIIHEAKILLKHTTWNISEIAYVLGFEEVAYFSNVFKKQTGMSPVAYRLI